jgi:chemotaxis signal transduction protein
MEHETTSSGPGLVLEARIGPWPLRIFADRVVEVVARVALGPLPGAPPGVRGVFQHRGEAAVAIDLRERFGAPAVEGRWDAFVVVSGSPRWALIVDEVLGVLPWPGERRRSVALPSERVAGLALGEDGAALLVEPGALLDEREVEALRSALEVARRGPRHAADAAADPEPGASGEGRGE